MSTKAKPWIAYVDGSYNADCPEVVGMGILLLDESGNAIIKGGKTANNPTLLELNNIGGEIGAAWLAVSFAHQLGCKRLIIYHDYMGVSNWPNGDWNANKTATKLYAEEINRFRNEESMDISFKHVDSHSDCIGNDTADYFANGAVRHYIQNRVA